ncbi:glycosyltransferase [Streptomyces sp. NPDC001816]|uniref:glycosyltransferase n=1 Tax=Streptomyces sp. NPDC001816 TaxID=3364612 RepID=UPI0036CA5D9E
MNSGSVAAAFHPRRRAATDSQVTPGTDMPLRATELSRQLRTLVDLRVRCFGEPRPDPGVFAYREPPLADGANAALRTLAANVEMSAACEGADLVHSHTWYANAAGQLARTVYGVPHVVTTHSLEPLRP